MDFTKQKLGFASLALVGIIAVASAFGFSLYAKHLIKKDSEAKLGATQLVTQLSDTIGTFRTNTNTNFESLFATTSTDPGHKHSINVSTGTITTLTATTITGGTYTGNTIFGVASTTIQKTVSSTIPATNWDATTTNQYAYFLLAAPDFNFTVDSVECQNVAATTTYNLIRTTSSVNTDGQLMANITCGTTATSTVKAAFTTTTVLSGNFVVVKTSSTVGTPTRDSIWLNITK